MGNPSKNPTELHFPETEITFESFANGYAYVFSHLRNVILSSKILSNDSGSKRLGSQVAFWV